jgi:hypothetical protein
MIAAVAARTEQAVEGMKKWRSLVLGGDIREAYTPMNTVCSLPPSVNPRAFIHS